MKGCKVERWYDHGWPDLDDGKRRCDSRLNNRFVRGSISFQGRCAGFRDWLVALQKFENQIDERYLGDSFSPTEETRHRIVVKGAKRG